MMRMSWMITVINRRMMKILIALALIAYIACEYITVTDTLTWDETYPAVYLLYFVSTIMENLEIYPWKVMWFNKTSKSDIKSNNRKLWECISPLSLHRITWCMSKISWYSQDLWYYPQSLKTWKYQYIFKLWSPVL